MKWSFCVVGIQSDIFWLVTPRATNTWRHWGRGERHQALSRSRSGRAPKAHLGEPGGKGTPRCEYEATKLGFDMSAPYGNAAYPIEADLDYLMDFAERNRESYSSAEPFPHIAIENFMRPECLNAVSDDFPSPGLAPWDGMVDQDQRKFATNITSMLPPNVRHMLYFLNSREIINFLEKLTGIQGLIPDPHLAGGGLHELRPGGFLKIHADFNWHTQMRLDRRINLLLYLNKDWQPTYAGNLELWDAAMTHRVKEYEPLFNRCVIFNTTNISFHGNPVPVNCPPNRSRRSIAMYYYTNGRPAEEASESHGTLFQNRPGEATAGEIATSFVRSLMPPIVMDTWRSLRNRRTAAVRPKGRL
jgi:Rps23 Pro-64 3,4-dihydroxylase Tpa1-like proline 4-hydroxylase